jgi:exosortase family protein XrtF
VNKVSDLSDQIKNNPFLTFFLKLLGVYIAWYLVYTYVIHPYQKVDLLVVDNSILISKWILEGLGYRVFTGVDRVIGIDGSGGLWVGDNCNGIALFALFTIFIAVYPGKWVRKIIFIPIGILLIHALNIVRIVVLAITDVYSRAWTEFNHTYTFTLVIYGFIFLLWILWVKKFNRPTNKPYPDAKQEA